MSTRRVRLRAALSAVVVLLTIAPTAVIGHAELDTISPANKSTGPSPTEIVGTFVQNLDPKKSSFAVVDSTGKVVAQGGQVASDDVRKMTLPLTAPLATGAYVIRWTTVSTEDGELARGTTTFTVVAATPAPSASPTPSAAPSASAAASTTPSLSPSPTAAPSVAPTPAASTSDALIPIIVALIVLAALGLWLLRSRSRRAG
jgi:methionine-rich copper-binding protein CopC